MSVATFVRMIVGKNEWSSGYGTDGTDCIEDFALNITFDHSDGKYWRLEKDRKVIAREAIYKGL